MMALSYKLKSMKLPLLVLSVVLCLNVRQSSAQSFALKTNVLGWATLTSNLEAEVRLSPKFTADLYVQYKPWHVLSDNRKIMGLSLQPEVRYWFCQSFYKHFLGVHFNYADYNGGLNEYRYQGYLLGAGLTYGYQMVLSQHWNLEFNVGVGWVWNDYDRYYRPKCGQFIAHENRHCFGLTKLGITFVYLFHKPKNK